MQEHSRIAVLALGLVAGLAQAQPVRYDGHRSVRVTVQSAREHQTVMGLSDEVLSCGGSGIGIFEVRMSPEHFAAFEGAAIAHEVLIPDLQAHIDRIWAEDAVVRLSDDPEWFGTYRGYAEITARLEALAAQFPQLATLGSAGATIEGRDVRMIRITGPGPTMDRPAFLINANQHAREWVAPMSAMYIVDRLLGTYTTDPRIQNVVNNIDFYIVPCANPDGYEYSRASDSLWRKNRRDNPGTFCDGVDLNRNWAQAWGYDNSGSSGNTCSQIYRGTAPFSEPETTNLKALSDMLASQGRLRVHWDIHSNSQRVLSSWAYTTSSPPDLPLMNTLGQIIASGMLTVRNTNYPSGQGSTLLSPSNGVAPDYSYGVNGAMAWTIELDGDSFRPPVGEILPIAQEALAGLLPLAEYYIPPACYTNCDASTTDPVLNVADFTCFLQRFATGQSYANCDGSTSPPTLNVADFTCFLQEFAAGCP